MLKTWFQQLTVIEKRCAIGGAVLAIWILGMVVLHPVLLVLDKSSKFTFVDVLMPINAPFEKFYVAFGTISLYLLLLVVISSQKKMKQLMGLRTWKYLHFVSYLTAILFTVHGIMLDPELKSRPVDFLDAEKVIGGWIRGGEFLLLDDDFLIYRALVALTEGEICDGKIFD